MPQANVSVTNIAFIDVVNTPNAAGATRCSTATFTLETNPPNGITQNSAGRLIVTADMMINFNFPNGSAFTPVGLSFKQTVGSIDPKGKNNMPKDQIKITEPPNSGPTLQFRDNCTNKGSAGTLVWKYYLVIQDSTGVVGIIDPEIENQN